MNGLVYRLESPADQHLLIVGWDDEGDHVGVAPTRMESFGGGNIAMSNWRKSSTGELSRRADGLYPIPSLARRKQVVSAESGALPQAMVTFQSASHEVSAFPSQ